MSARVITAMLLTAALAAPQADRQLWMRIKRELRGPGGEAYFQAAVKNARLPPLAGTPVASLLNDGISELKVGIENRESADARLIVHHPGHRMKEKHDPVVRFSGVALSFTQDPVVVTFGVNMGDIKGVQFERISDFR